MFLISRSWWVSSNVAFPHNFVTKCMWHICLRCFILIKQDNVLFHLQWIYIYTWFRIDFVYPAAGFGLWCTENLNLTLLHHYNIHDTDCNTCWRTEDPQYFLILQLFWQQFCPWLWLLSRLLWYPSYIGKNVYIKDPSCSDQTSIQTWRLTPIVPFAGSSPHQNLWGPFAAKPNGTRWIM